MPPFDHKVRVLFAFGLDKTFEIAKIDSVASSKEPVLKVKSVSPNLMELKPLDARAQYLTPAIALHIVLLLETPCCLCAKFLIARSDKLEAPALFKAPPAQKKHSKERKSERRVFLANETRVRHYYLM